MTQYEEELQARMNANLLLNKEEMNIKDRLMWNISESCVSDDDLITSQKFSALLKRYSDQKWVCDYFCLPKMLKIMKFSSINSMVLERTFLCVSKKVRRDTKS